MRILDIIALKEDLDIRQVSGGFEIFDTETGQRAPNSIIYPDEGSAETSRDRMRAAQPGNNRTTQPNNNQPSTNNNQPDTNQKRNQIKETFKQKWARRFTKLARLLRGIRGITGAAVIMTNYDEHVERQADLLAAHLVGDRNGNKLTEAQYLEASKREYETWLASMALVAGGSIAQTAAVTRGARRILQFLRGINVATSTPMLVAGPWGAAAAVVKFVLFEAASWAAIWVLSRRESAEAVVAWLIYHESAGIFEQLAGDIVEIATEYGAAGVEFTASNVGRLVAAGADAANQPGLARSIERSTSDIRRLVGARPDAVMRDQVAGDRVEPEANQSAPSSSSRMTPAPQD
jgi:hypothetical protein